MTPALSAAAPGSLSQEAGEAGDAQSRQDETMGSAQPDRITRRQVEKLVSWTLGEWLRYSWFRLRMTVGEMNYASSCLFGPMILMPGEPFRLDQPGSQG